MYVFMYSCIHVCLCSHMNDLCFTHFVYTYMNICISYHIIYIYIYLRVCVHVYIHICMHAFAHLCMCVCIYIYTHTHIHVHAIMHLSLSACLYDSPVYACMCTCSTAHIPAEAYAMHAEIYIMACV